jgi:RimJ/RimL family protein N-acetyltransferase
MWKPLIVPSDAYLRELWLKCQQVPLAWHPHWGTIESFGRWLMQRDSLFFAVLDGADEVGLVYAERVIPDMDAWLGIIMFDRQLRGREEAIHSAVSEMFKIAGLARISMLVPRTREVVAKLSRRLGFRHEGIMRRAYRAKNGSFEDCDLFGLLVEDLWRYTARAVSEAGANGPGVLERDRDAREVCTGTMDRILDELAPPGLGPDNRLDEELEPDGSDRGSPGPGSE